MYHQYVHGSGRAPFIAALLQLKNKNTGGLGTRLSSTHMHIHQKHKTEKVSNKVCIYLLEPYSQAHSVTVTYSELCGQFTVTNSSFI